MSGLVVRDSGLVVPGDVRGHGTIELRDERTDKVMHRESFENFISSETKAYMKWMARRTFWHGIAGTRSGQSNRDAGDPNLGSYGTDAFPATNVNGGDSGFASSLGMMYRNPNTPFAHTDYEPRYGLFHCAVWTDTSAEDPTNEKNAIGNIIAWANRQTYSGVDTKRGAVNLTECFTDPTKVKYVFDWPTSAGNGTFQSVGWLHLVQGTNLAYQAITAAVRLSPPSFGQAGTPFTGTSSDASQRSDVDTVNDRILSYQYDGGSPSHYRIWPVSWAGVWGPSALFDINTAVGGTQPGSGGIACVGTNIYLAESQRTVTPCLRRVDFSGAAVSSLASTWTTLLGLSGADNVSSIAYDGTNLWVAAGINSVKTTVWKINPSTGAIIQTIDCSPYLGSAATITVASNGDIWVGDVGYGLARFSSAGAFKGLFSQQDTSYNSQIRDLMWRNSGGVDRLYQNGYNFYQFYQVNMRSLGARSLLGSAVTKSVTQTMKVTYEFDFS